MPDTLTRQLLFRPSSNRLFCVRFRRHAIDVSVTSEVTVDNATVQYNLVSVNKIVCLLYVRTLHAHGFIVQIDSWHISRNHCSVHSSIAATIAGRMCQSFMSAFRSQ